MPHKNDNAYRCEPLGDIVNEGHDIDRRKCSGVQHSVEKLRAFVTSLGLAVIICWDSLSVQQTGHRGARCTFNMRIYILKDGSQIDSKA